MPQGFVENRGRESMEENKIGRCVEETEMTQPGIAGKEEDETGQQ